MGPRRRHEGPELLLRLLRRPGAFDDEPTSRAHTHAHPSTTAQVANWVVTKSELKMEVIMTLKLVAGAKPAAVSGGGGAEGEAAGPQSGAPPAAAAAAATAPASATEDETRLTGLAGGCCFAFNPFQENLWVPRVCAWCRVRPPTPLFSPHPLSASLWARRRARCTSAAWTTRGSTCRCVRR